MSSTTTTTTTPAPPQLHLHAFNKNYSSWSIRPWLLIIRLHVDAKISFYNLADPESKARGKAMSVSGTLPALTITDGSAPAVSITDSLAIIETIADLFPGKHVWPKDLLRRAQARSVAAEMHSGFSNVRTHMTCNLRARYPPQQWNPATAAEVTRILTIWETCRADTVKAKDTTDDGWLFGEFCAADAMYFPVVTRFITYAVEIDASKFPLAKEYSKRVLTDPIVGKIYAEAFEDDWVIPHYENTYPGGRKEQLA